MISNRKSQTLFLASVSLAAVVAASPGLAQQAAAAKPAADVGKSDVRLGEVIVTAQRRSESIQNVPIAVSAISGGSLKAQRLDSGGDLLLSVPNVTFARGNFGGFNFQIRGIGTKLVASSADAAIGVHENSIPLTASTLADADFFDVTRVEVLRGPQGTQFGRNTTGGLVNIITNQPTDRFEGALTGEYGAYNTKKFNGFVNVPLGHDVDLRVAGAFIDRDGYGHNDITNHSIDGRKVYSTRATLSWRPTDKFKATLMWEHFNENDNRDRVGKQLCISDPGPATVGGVSTGLNRNNYSQGCQGGQSLDGANALGEVNSAATLGGGLGVATGLITGNAYAGKVQDPNLHNIESVFDPKYKHNNNLYMGRIEFKPTDNLEVTYTGSYSVDTSFSEADYNRATPTQTFNANAPTICAAIGVGAAAGCNNTYTLTNAGGYFVDPQVGTRNQFTTIDFTDGDSQQLTQEIRVQSSFAGPLNFSAGASYLRFHTLTNYYVTSNTLTAASEGVFNPLSTLNGAGVGKALCPATGSLTQSYCVYVDPNAIPTGIGHNYFDSRTDYTLNSYAAFAEVNYRLLDDLMFTGGVRYTDDSKRVVAFAPPLFVNGYGVGTPPAGGFQDVGFGELTGRVNLAWTPHTGFTDKTMIYASYARGYKGGGFNPPQSPGQVLFPATFAPEFIDSIEVGTKNTLLGGALVFDATGFYYNYAGYQVSEIIQRTSVNVNINAKIYGAEVESLWQPVKGLTFNANIGYLHTELDPTSSIDLTNLTQNDPTYQVIKNGLTYANCIAPTAQLAALQTKLNAASPAVAGILAGSSGLIGIVPGAAGVCNGGFATGSAGATAWGAAVDPYSVNGSVVPGKSAQIGGNQLPNSPHWTVSLGAQYRWTSGPWTVTPRADFYYQASSYARIFNAPNDVLKSYTNTNLSLTLDREDWGLNVQLYVKNLFDKTVITDKYITDDSSGLFTNIFLNDPRTYGVSLTKRF